ncbi:hypothetical protein ACHAWT_003348 [Skeletonema menzelii]
MGDDEGDEKRSIKLGRRRKPSSSSLVKYILGVGGAALMLMIFHHGKNKGIIPPPPRLRAMTRTYLHQDWHKWSRRDFRAQFQCSHHLSVGKKSVPTLEYWQTLRDVYNSEVDSSVRFDDPVPPTQGYTLNENGAPPYYAKLSPGKGRGLFASRNIQEGELVDGIEGGTKSDMIFTTIDAMRRYLLALPAPMACDVLEWTYTQKIVKGGPPVLVVVSDISSLMNAAWDDDADPNVMPKDKTSSMLLYATRDIKKDEEILMSYGVFPGGIW